MRKYKAGDKVLVQLWNTYGYAANVKHGEPFETVITQELDHGDYEIERPGGPLRVSTREIVRVLKAD